MLAEIFMTEVPDKINNLIGTRFGDGCIVIAHLGRNKSIQDRSHQWLCQCACGNEFKVNRFKILSKKYGQKSCPSCVYKNRVVNKVEMIGRQFGRWTVLKEDKPGITRSLSYICRCDCGTVKDVCGSNLRDGSSKSCGCLLLEKLKSQIGSKNPNWNNNITDEERQEKRSARNGGMTDYDMINWRTGIFERDNYTCKCCGTIESPFNAHHLNGWHWAEEQRYDNQNGVTLCVQCHKLFHRQYGQKYNTKEQYQEFFLLRYNG